MPGKKLVVKKKKVSVAMEPVTDTRVVYLAGCKNCHHVPLGVNSVLTILVAVIFTLAAMLMAAAVTMNSQSYQLDVFNNRSGSIHSVASR